MNLSSQTHNFNLPKSNFRGMSSAMSLPSGRLTHKTPIVTGSSAGIGCAITILYVREEAKVVCSNWAYSLHSISSYLFKMLMRVIEYTIGQPIHLTPVLSFDKTMRMNARPLAKLLTIATVRSLHLMPLVRCNCQAYQTTCR